VSSEVITALTMDTFSFLTPWNPLKFIEVLEEGTVSIFGVENKAK
jgi:hypothetical protein